MDRPQRRDLWPKGLKLHCKENETTVRSRWELLKIVWADEYVRGMFSD